MTSLALELHRITRRFGDVTALDDATLAVRAGTVHALLGENGAGKTTLMRVAFGMVRADAGAIRIEGNPVDLRSPGDAIAAGMGMVHQHFALVPTMTVAENVALGGRGRYSARSAADRVRSIGESSGLRLDPEALAGDLPVSGQQRLEIVKALSRNARVLILDEPTAVLAPAEVAELLSQLRSLADEGRTIVLITHKLREALSIADDVTVLRRGAVVFSAPSSEASESSLASSILGGGREGDTGLVAELDLLAGAAGSPGPSPRRPKGHVDPISIDPSPKRSTKTLVEDALMGDPHRGDTPRPLGEPVVEARQLGVTDARGVVKIRDANFAVHRGEMVGVAAVEGAGHHELLRVLAGRIDPTSGVLRRPERSGFIPEDRQGEALILDFSLTENVVLRDAGSLRGVVDWTEADGRTTSLIQEFGVRAAGSRAPVSSLSGGNQQKLVLARELQDAPALLIAENPTRGLDIQASAMVHTRLGAAASDGTAVILYSSDLDELLALASRILVVFAGTVQDVAHDREAIGRGMLGLQPTAPK